MFILYVLGGDEKHRRYSWKNWNRDPSQRRQVLSTLECIMQEGSRPWSVAYGEFYARLVRVGQSTVMWEHRKSPAQKMHLLMHL